MINDKPGPELDKVIFEQVLKWEKYHPWPGTTWYVYPEKDDDGETVYCDPNTLSPSETWAGMQLVVEEMQRRGFSLCINTVDHNSAAFINGEAELGTWHSNVKSLDKVNYRAHADTAPHAVCMASLKALEDDRD